MGNETGDVVGIDVAEVSRPKMERRAGKSEILDSKVRQMGGTAMVFARDRMAAKSETAPD
jgi:hypothetical protein